MSTDAPTSADNTISMFTSDTSYTFKAADFAFMDADSEHTELASITITATTIPSGASFTNAGNAVTDDTEVMSADIGDLVFTPASGAAAMDNYASFTFTVSDGSASSDPANTITINLVPPPQMPATGMPAITGTAEQFQTLNAALGTVADINGINQSTIAWQWQQAATADSTSWADIAADDGDPDSLTLTQSHVGLYLRVCASFEDEYQNPATGEAEPASEGPLCSAVAGPIANAPAVTVGTTVSGSISAAGEVDWYSFTLESPSFVTIQTTGSTDTWGRLYHSVGVRLEYDDNGGAGNNFRIHRYLGAGTYYIRVAGQYTTGEYELSVAEGSATAVTVGTPVSGSISERRDVDWYSFTLESPSLVNIEATGSLHDGVLYDSAGTSLEGDRNDGTGGNNFRIHRYLGAGTYYIRVEGRYTTGEYELSVAEVSATAVTLGTPVSGSISERGEVDWYSFTLSARSEVVIETTGSTDTHGQLWDSAGAWLGTRSR